MQIFFYAAALSVSNFFVAFCKLKIFIFQESNLSKKVAKGENVVYPEDFIVAVALI